MKLSLFAAGAVAAIVLVVVVARSSRVRPDLVIGDAPQVAALPRCDRERRVDTAEALEQALRSDFVGCVIVTKDTFLNMTGRAEIPVRGGVRLMGERGELGSRPSLFTDNQCLDPRITDVASPECEGYSLLVIRDNTVSVTGLHLRGPANGSRSSAQPYINGIRVIADPNNGRGRGIHIAENEFNEWAGSGVDVISRNRARVPEQYEAGWTPLTKADAGLIRVERNYFHHNAREGGGYGVTVNSGAFATVFGNVFDFNRHAVASNGFARTGYVARFNYVLQGGFKQSNYYNQHFDVHGTNDTDGDDTSTGYGGAAGDDFEVAFNAIRGDQGYFCFFFCLKTRPALMLRGRPTTAMRFDANVVAHDNLDAAVSLKTDKSDTGWGEHHDEFNFHAAGNQFGTDRSRDLATGDFDGDGRTDVFVATGTAWFFSRGGQSAWEFLHASTKLTRELGFADIDNDATTDVLYRDGAGNLGFLKSGRVPLQPLTTVPEPITKLRFGDFDGDGFTDIFYTRANRWHVWYGRFRDWQATQTSGFAVEDLLFGEFDAVTGTDVAAVTGGQWQVSRSATRSWARLNARRRASFRHAVVADFDGDGRSDIAFDDGRQNWSVSSGGAGPLLALREADGQFTIYPELHRLLVGHFDGDPRAEVVSYFFPSGESLPAFPNHFMIWRGPTRARFEQRSLHPMR